MLCGFLLQCSRQCCATAASVFSLSLSFSLFAFIFVYIVWEQRNTSKQLWCKKKSPRAFVSFITPGRPSTLLFFFLTTLHSFVNSFMTTSRKFLFLFFFSPFAHPCLTVLCCLSPVAVLYGEREGGMMGWAVIKVTCLWQ